MVPGLGAFYRPQCPRAPPGSPARICSGARAEHSCSRARLHNHPSDRLCVCAAWSDRVVSVVAPSWRLVFENSIAWGSSTASGRSVDRSRFYKKHRTVMVSWASPRHRFLTSSGLTAGPFRGSASDQLPSQHTALLSSSADLVSRLGASTVRTVFHGEFDPGSGRTLAACLTHASRAERLPSGSTRAANG